MMSYFDGIDVGETSRWSASTPLIADVEAVIRRFFSTVDANGERTYQTIDLNTGDDVYGFNGSFANQRLTSSGMQHDIGFLIHDTGGNDTIDFSGSTAGTILDLMLEAASQVVIILLAIGLLLLREGDRSWLGWIGGGLGATALGVAGLIAAQRLGLLRLVETGLERAAARARSAATPSTPAPAR